MKDGERLIDPELMESLGSLELRARMLADGALAGLHRSSSIGGSVEFAGHREYSPGDDFRSVDWKAFARRDRFYVKEAEDETNTSAILVVDSSASMAYGPGGVAKYRYASVLAASIAIVLLRQGDAAGLITTPGGRRIAPKPTRPYAALIAGALESAEPSGPASIKAALAEAGSLAPRRSMVLVFSDLLDFDPAAKGSVAALCQMGLDVTVFHIMDRTEIDFPFEGPALFTDPESDRESAVSASAIAREYRREFAGFADGWRDLCTGAGADYVRVVTDEPPGELLRGFLARRRRGVG